MTDLIKAIIDCKERIINQKFDLPPAITIISSELLADFKTCISQGDLDDCPPGLGTRLSYYEKNNIITLKIDYTVNPPQLSDGWVLLWEQVKGA